MNLNNQSIQGFLSVSRSVTTGGRLTVRGNSVFGHNVIIKGWLDARNIKGACKGLYASVEKLEAAYPKAMPGWYALVGDTLPADVYRAEGGKWVATGEKGGEVNLYLDQLEEDVANLDDEVANLDEKVVNLDDEVASLDDVLKDIQVLIGNGLLVSGSIEFNSTATAAKMVYKLRKLDGTEKEYEVTVPIVTSENAGLMTAADKRKLDSLSDRDPAVLVTELDSLFSKEAMTAEKPLRYIVTQVNRDRTMSVGILDMFSDNMGHMLTQVLTTHYKMNSDGVLDFGAHTDDKIYTYFRSYHLSGGTSAIPEGTWGAWKLMYDSDTRTLIDTILDIDMLTADDKGVAGGVATLGADGKILPEQLPDVMPPSGADVLMYGGIVSGVEVMLSSIGSPDAVVYDAVKKTFLALAVPSGTIGSPVYYINWGENATGSIPMADSWGRYTDTGREPFTGKLYIDTAGKKICWWDGESLTWDGSSSTDIRELTDEEIDRIVAKLLEAK